MVRGVRVAVVPRMRAESLRKVLHAAGVIDRTHKITKRGVEVLIPLRAAPSIDLAAFGARLESVEGLEARPRPRSPLEALKEAFDRAGIPAGVRPSRWERIGDIVLVRLAEPARPFAAAIGRTLGTVLHARTVVEIAAPVQGPMRTPDIRVLWGDGTETVHVEGGVRYKLDVGRVMFSSGNLSERLGVARLVRPGDVIVDLFAGIGYFTLPIAVRARPQRVYACELNPVAFEYLLENVRLNRAQNVLPLLGDCRATAPVGVADVVLMGHFDAAQFLDVAFRSLRASGTIVYHELCPKERFSSDPQGRIAEAARSFWYQVTDSRARIAKSYAPGIVHAVVEARVEPIMRRKGRTSAAR